MTYPYICFMDASDKRKPISRIKNTPNISIISFKLSNMVYMITIIQMAMVKKSLIRL